MARRPFRFATIWVAGNLLVATTVSLAPAAMAQTPAVEPADTSLAEDDPYVTQLRQRAATGNDMQIADALSGFAGIGNWQEVDQILTSAAAAKRDDSVAAEMARRIGSTLLLRMARNEQLSQPAKDFVADLSSQLAQSNVAPQRLREAIDDLDAATVDEQLAAIRTLLSGGDASTRELVMTIVSDNPSADVDSMLRTLLRLGDGGTKALRQIALYGAPAQRTKAVDALGRISPINFVADLVTAYHAADASEDERASAAGAMRRTGLAMPSRSDAIIYLSDELRRAGELAKYADGDDSVVEVWNLQPDRSSVQNVGTYPSLAASHARADAAARLRRLGELPETLEQSALVADLSYRVNVDPLWGDTSQVDAIRAAYGNSAQPSAVVGAMSMAISDEDWPAVVGLVQLVDPESGSLEKETWLSGTAGQPSPLVQAVRAPLPRVRYEAASAITRLEPSFAYAGSSLVRATLAEMAQLNRRPVAILVETYPEMLSRQETSLNKLGFHVDTVVDVAELERRVAAGGDLRLVMSKSGLADARPIELVDRVRRISRGEQLPIIIYSDELDVLGQNRWDVPTAQIPPPMSPGPIRQLVASWQRAGQLPPLIESERVLYQSIGREALGVDRSE